MLPALSVAGYTATTGWIASSATSIVRAPRAFSIDERRTRLISRSRVRAQGAGRLLTHAIEPAGFLMTRRMLLGLKQRAEALRAASNDETRANVRPPHDLERCVGHSDGDSRRRTDEGASA